MTINLSVPRQTELKPRITVFGVGGAGGNGVNNMIQSGLEGVDFVVANTDAQALSQSLADRLIQMGTAITQGLGAGSRPQVGQAAAEEAIEEISEHLTGCHMTFITAGMGGGTGTGAAPVIARAAREMGILTVGVVTKPFQFEGARRMRVAEEGIQELQKYVDTLIIIPNQNLFRLANEKTTFAEAFGMADQVLRSGVAGITDLMVRPGEVNLDFADVRTVMNEMGKAMMGTGEATGEKRALEAAEAAISNPLLDEVSMKGARGLLINITGGSDLTLYEVDEAANRIRGEVDPEANIIVGSTLDESVTGSVRVSVVATGIDCEAEAAHAPQSIARAAEPVRGFRLKAAQEAEADTAARAAATANADRAPLRAASAEIPAHIDPAEYEAEVIIRKPEPQPQEGPAAHDRAGDGRRLAAADEAGGGVVAQKGGTAFIAPEPKRPAARPRKRTPGFFERITGGALGGRAEDAPMRRGAAPRASAAPAVRAEPRTSPFAGRPAQETPRAPLPDRSGQAGGSAAREPRDLAPDAAGEEQLEIPAFLRRQAN